MKQCAGETRRWWHYLLALGVGFLNGVFGAGGGIIAVPMLRKMGVTGQKAHATSLAITLPLTLCSIVLYLGAGNLPMQSAWHYLPGGLAGALLGAWLLPRIGTLWLRRLFGVVILFAATRLLLR